MKRKFSIFILIISFIFTMQAQVVSEDRDSVSVNATMMRGNTISRFSSDSISVNPDFLVESYLQNSLLAPVDLKIHKPLLLYYTQNDTTKLSSSLSLTPFNRYVSYVLGSSTTVGYSLLYKPSDKFSIEAEGFYKILLDHVFHSREMIFGYDLMLTYDITERLRFSLWGQYMTKDIMSPAVRNSIFFPGTNVGTSLEFKPSENVKIGVGGGNQYNKQDKVWRPKTGTKVTIGF